MKKTDIKRETGSAMLLVLIVSLVLSLIVGSSLKVTSKEMESASHNLLQKQAYLIAQKGVEEARNMIEKTEDQAAIESYNKSYSDTVQNYDSVIGFPIKAGYVTGSFETLHNNLTGGGAPVNLSTFLLRDHNRLKVPTPKGYSQSMGVTLNIWEVRIAAKAEIANGRKSGYAEITAGIADINNQEY